ncbi:MAG: DUF4153 domain-containing protein [Alphaproteobacteria bacterium]|nr:DUF4153 domain-containing protein [Alphaproteobacteria bacterium]
MAADTADGSTFLSLGASRLLVGLAQGCAALVLVKAGETHAWPATEPWLFASLIAFVALVPPTVLTGLGQMRMAMLSVWTFLATACVVYVAYHGVTRESVPFGDSTGLALLLLAGALFVAYHLVAAADQDRRLVANYRTYFDIAWRNGVQLALSLLFVGAFWLLLFLGAALFDLIKIDAVSELIKRDWFIYPTSAIVFALAVHVSDMRVGLIDGARALALVLLSWLLPVMTLFAVAFLGALPVTGLEPLWATGSATALLLAAAVALVVLINAAYQHGDPDMVPHAILKIAARFAGLALLPIVAIAGYSIWLRIGQHGLTPERVMAVAFVAVEACYAVGYAIAALWPGRWMRPLEATNILAGFVMVGIVVALLTPIGDPARLAVDDQVRRLKAGIVSAEKFDYNFLRFDAARYGVEALNQLVADKSSPRAQAIAAKAEEALAKKVRGVTEQLPQELLAQIVVYPKGATLPDSFLAQNWAGVAYSPVDCARYRSRENRCEAFLTDFDGDTVVEVLTGNGHRINVWRLSVEKVWTLFGWIDSSYCVQKPGWTMLEALRAGRFKTVAPVINDLEVDGKRVRLQDCPQ